MITAKLLLLSDCEFPQFNNYTTYQGSQTTGTGATLKVTCIPNGYFFAQEEHYLVDPRVGVIMTCNRSRWDVRTTPNCERK